MTLLLPERNDTVPSLTGESLELALDAETADDDTFVGLPLKVPLVALSAGLSTLGAGWLLTRLFRGSPVPELLTVVAVLLGTGLVALASRLPRPGPLPYAVTPVALTLAAIAASTSGGHGSLPTKVGDALRRGGLREAPIPFDAGWRFLLVLLLVLVAAGACGVALSLQRPKLAVAVPLPLTLAAALLQPKGSEILGSGPAVALTVASLAVAYGADLAAQGVGGGGFELRRMLRGASLLVAVLLILGLLARTDALFPATERNQVIPPQKPPAPTASHDRVLFTVHSDRAGPWRVGVLDVYGQNAFLLPPVDQRRVLEVPKSGQVPALGKGHTYTATFLARDLTGQTLPAPANPMSLEHVSAATRYDPRTQIFRLKDENVPNDFAYTVEGLLPPDGKALAAAVAPQADIASTFGSDSLPAAPDGVKALLARAPTKDLFDRLQFVRNALYTKVVAAGSGRPVDILPTRVDDMLQGGESTPYEIVAAEVLLARWAGVPARLGFGFYDGDKGKDGTVSFRPRHGAAWLEAYFQGYGWIPVIGMPPKAKPSLSNDHKKKDKRISATDQLALEVFVPVRVQGIRLFYQVVRYYAVRILPALLGLALLLVTYPIALKRLRSRRRRRWGSRHGLAGRLAVTYAEFRDRAHDLNIGKQSDSPLEFLARVEDDDEHEELAWLVTRGLWGDLNRDLREADVVAAGVLAASVLRRLQREQSGPNRFLAQTARGSLRDPWSLEIPNAWHLRRARAGRRLPWRRLRIAAAAAALAGCASVSAGPVSPAEFPLVPTTAAGHQLTLERQLAATYNKAKDAALVSSGRVYTIRDGDTVQGSMQIALFKPDVDGQDGDIQRGIEKGLGAVRGFQTVRLGLLRLRVLPKTEQVLYLWFPPERNVMELFVLRKDFADADRVVRELVLGQRGLNPGSTS